MEHERDGTPSYLSEVTKSPGVQVLVHETLGHIVSEPGPLARQGKSALASHSLPMGCGLWRIGPRTSFAAACSWLRVMLVIAGDGLPAIRWDSASTLGFVIMSQEGTTARLWRRSCPR